MLRRLISPTRTRARIFDRDANLLLDSRHLYSRGQVLRFDLPPVEDESADLVATGSAACFNKHPAARQPAGLQGSAGRRRLDLSRK